ncbi:MAG: hypothetical protein PWP23_1378 [Candidatus Sumerlaeota bacterium]|nr:hypothetical protein [Candidatus Sumerlaeota bacterium]
MKPNCVRKLREYCSNCDHSGEFDVVIRPTTIKFRGESYHVTEEFVVCSHCKSEFDSFKIKTDPLVQVFRKYREKHGLLHSEEIRAIRELYGITQKELAAILGFGPITISRYENGSLQDKAHDTLLRLIQDPRNLLQLLKSGRAGEKVMSKKKQTEVIAKAQQLLSEKRQKAMAQKWCAPSKALKREQPAPGAALAVRSKKWAEQPMTPGVAMNAVPLAA